MRYIKYLLFTVLFIAFYGCKPTVLQEEVRLDLSKDEVMFNKDGGNQTVDVESTSNNWSVLTPDNLEWLKVEQQKNKLQLIAEPTGVAKVRTAKVVLIAGGVVKTLVVKQEPAPVRILTPSNEFVLPSSIGKSELDYAANTNNIVCELAEPCTWLTIQSNPDKMSIILTTTSVNTGADRSVKLLIKSEGDMAEVTIIQKGQLSFYLPYIQDPVGGNQLREILAYEREHGGVQLEYTQTSDKKILSILPGTKLFSQVTYEFPNGTPYYNKVSTVMSPTDEVTLNDYCNFLLNNHFVKDVDDSSDQRQVYTSEDGYLSVTLEQYGKYVIVDFAYSEPKPTFDKFPFTVDRINNADWNLDKINKLETDRGNSQLRVQEWGTENDYYYSTSTAGVSHYYTINNESHMVTEEGLSVNNDKADLVVIGNFDQFSASKAFEKMLRKNGFVFDKFISQGRVKQAIYKNDTLQRSIVIIYNKNGVSLRYLPLS